MTRIFLVWLLLFLSSNILFSQNSKVSGTIFDNRTNETLPGVNVRVDSSSVGTVTNLLGKYSLEITPGKHTLTFSYLGYATVTKDVNAVSGMNQEINLRLETEQKELKIVTVTGSQFEKDIAKEIVSIDVIKKYLVENTNATDLAKAVEKVPGVTIVDGQASIRGGSGYAYGTGSRVQVLVDDLPMLSGDLSEVRWNFVPIETMEQVEVIKGAASSMYGSGAMNGVIHVRTGYAYEKPQTKFGIAQGIYSNPKRNYLRWWDNMFNPFFTNAFLSHRQKFGNVDLVAGANLIWDSGFKKYASDQQARANIKLRWRPAKAKRWSFEVFANSMYQQFGRFFLWSNADTGAYIPLSGTNSSDKYSYFNVDPRVTYTGPKGSIHKLRGRFYNVSRLIIDKPGKDASSNLYWGDYQFQKRFDFGLTATAGISGSISKSFSNLYEGIDLFQVFTAQYVQVEKTFGDRVTLLGGARYEINKVYGLPDDPPKPVFRTGINVQAAKFTHLRATWGQGYRFPSLGERYVEAALGNIINVVPNPNLLPEYGWTSEIALKQGYKAGDLLGYLDFAIFWSEFKDMIEYSFILDPKVGLGFQAQNISKARIAGFEVSTMADGKLFNIPIRIYGGYTFNYPADLINDTNQLKANIFLQNLFQSFRNSDSLQTSILKYRLRNTARFDIEFDLFKKITLGGSLSYNSFMERIDAVFDLIKGVQEYRVLNDKGIIVFDSRLAYKISDRSNISLIVKNLTNKEYSLRPGLMEAPRSFTLQYRIAF